MSDSRPIGVFDSGLGGLTVVREISRIMPNERVVYLGDTARCPYGGRSNDTIIQFGVEDTKFLLTKDIKMLIVACNTVSSVALKQIRDVVKGIPVIGVVLPGCKAAVNHTAIKKIGIIGTTATIRAKSYNAGITNLNKQITVFGKECPLFVPIVEEGLFKTDIARQAAQHYLYDLVDMGIDVLVLGCTHYPLLMEVIQETVNNGITLIDSAMWAAREARDIINAMEIRSLDEDDGLEKSAFYVTDHTPDFEKSAELFLGRALNTVKYLHIEEIIKE